MPRLLALEWDSRQARVAVARTRGREAVVEHAFSVDLGTRDPGETLADVNVGERIAAALAARRIGHGETLVAVGRSSIELRRLALPPAPPEELPDMVRFQAMREFTGLGEDWPLDFAPLGAAAPESAGAEAGALNVLAAAISPKLVGQIRETCQAAELNPHRLVLRPFAAAALLRRAHPSSQCRLLVDLLSDEADLTVLIGEHVVFVRTVRLPNVAGEAQNRALLGEARRTIAAAQNQLGGRRVEQVVLCGEDEQLQAVATLAREQLGVEVETFDPFSAVPLGGELHSGLPADSGRFAPLLGMLQNEAAQTPHDIDFLNPRRRPKPPSRMRQYALAAAAAAVLVAGGAFLIWERRQAAQQEIVGLQSEINDLDEKVDLAPQLQAKAEEIDDFVRGDVTWLEELSEISQELPPADRVLATRLRAISLPAGGGQILLDGYAKDADDISQMVRNLQDDRHVVHGKGGHESNQRSDYPWRFDNAAIQVPPPEIETSPDQDDTTNSPR